MMRSSFVILSGLLAAPTCESQIVSFDAGHEFFKVALMRQGAPLEVVLNGHSKRKTPTAVSFFDNIRNFGDDAVPHAGKAPSKVPMMFHSFMGNNFTSAEDVKDGGAWWKRFGLSPTFYKYNVVYDEERSVPGFQISEDHYASQEEVLANILEYAKGMAEESADNKAIRDLVITVPSDAGLRQRQALVAAGEIAGMRVLTLVHETAAFAIQRAVDFQPEKGAVDHILFYNLGSRHCEVVVAKFESKQAGMVAGKTAPVVTIVGSATDFEVGGHLFDIKIAEVMLQRFQEKNPKLADGIVKSPKALRKLLSTAQKTKAVLSANKNAPFICESLYDDVDFQSSLNREQFEELCGDMFSKLTTPIERALEKAGLTMSDITQVEVVGGAWRIPKIQSLLSEYIESKKGSKLPLGQHLNGEEGAAMGAALVGANSSSSFRVKKIFFTDVTAHAYAVQVAALNGEWEKNVTTLYPVGAALGGKKKLSFNMAEDFSIRLFEDGVLVAEYAVTGLAEQMESKWSAYSTTGNPKLSVSVKLEPSGLIEIQTPLATVEELYWVNVTVPKKKDNATAASSSEDGENATDAEKETEEDKSQEDSAKSVNGTNASNATEETEVVQKQKKKKHEKKLTVARVDFKPMPLSADGVKKARKTMEERRQREEDVQKVTALKNELEAAIYGSRDKLEREDIVKVTTEEQREAVVKTCAEYEEWMYEGVNEKTEYESRVNKLRDLLGPMEERAVELEARSDLPESVQELVADCDAALATIQKNMSWVNANKTEAAGKNLAEFKEWWEKKQEQQRQLPLHEAPAYTRSQTIEKINKINKEFQSLLKTKKPKEKKVKESKNSTATDKKAEKKTEEELPSTIEATEKEIASVAAKKGKAVEDEDFDGAQTLKLKEKKLKEHLAKLKEEL